MESLVGTVTGQAIFSPPLSQPFHKICEISTGPSISTRAYLPCTVHISTVEMLDNDDDLGGDDDDDLGGDDDDLGGGDDDN